MCKAICLTLIIDSLFVLQNQMNKEVYTWYVSQGPKHFELQGQLMRSEKLRVLKSLHTYQQLLRFQLYSTHFILNFKGHPLTVAEQSQELHITTMLEKQSAILSPRSTVGWCTRVCAAQLISQKFSPIPLPLPVTRSKYVPFSSHSKAVASQKKHSA